MRSWFSEEDERAFWRKVYTDAMSNTKAAPPAQKLLADRFQSPLKPIDLPVQFSLPVNGSLTQRSQAMSQAVADGHLTPSEGAALQVGLGSHARVVEIDELARRVEALEKANRAPFDEADMLEAARAQEEH